MHIVVEQAKDPTISTDRMALVNMFVLFRIRSFGLASLVAGVVLFSGFAQRAGAQTARDDILATTYVLPGSVLIALASWSDSDQQVRLSLDQEALGLGAETAARAPGVDGLQEADDVDLSAVSVPAGQGLWIVVEDN